MHRMPSPAAVLLDLPKLAMATSERSFPSTPGEKMGEAAEGAGSHQPHDPAPWDYMILDSER
jgi:hypothetical protein